MKTIKMYSASAQTNSSDDEKGTPSNPYTEEEFNSMFAAGTWNGGYVDGLGYVAPGTTIYGSSSSFSDSDSDSWSDPWGSISDPWSSSEDNNPSRPSGGGGGNTSENPSRNTLVIGTHTEISKYSQNILRSLKGNYGKIVITSTFRSPKEQAKAMLNNIKRTGVDAQLALYASPGDAVIRTYNSSLSDAENLEAMIDEIYNQGARNVSKHCMTPEEYNTLNVMDISRGQITNPSGFIKELKNTVPDIVYFDEKSNGCIHIEIPQP